MIRVGVIGYGYWGPNLARNFGNVEGVVLAKIADADEQRLALAERNHPGVACTSDGLDIIRDPSIDAVAIATPVATHYELALLALAEGKHLWIEKPLAETSEQAKRLRDEGDQRGLVILVDHTFLFTPAVRKIRDLVDDGHLGEIYYFDSVRVNLGLFQHDVNVAFDLAVHDLSIMQHVLQRLPEAVSATGMANLPGRPENVAFLTCFFDSPLIAHVHVNWLAPVKVRRTLIGGESKMIVYDDLEPSEKIKIYDRGVTLEQDVVEGYEPRIDYRTGDMWAPHLEQREALLTGVEHFVHCIETGEPPLTGAEEGLHVVEVLEAANKSLLLRGRPVELGSRLARSA